MVLGIIRAILRAQVLNFRHVAANPKNVLMISYCRLCYVINADGSRGVVDGTTLI